MRKLITLALSLVPLLVNGQEVKSLNGRWEMGESRRYDREVEVPGVHCDPAKMNEDTLWYRQTVVFPKGKWQYATLELKGAPIKQTDISSGYKRAYAGQAKRIIRMVNAGKNLTRVPVIMVEFGDGKGNLIVSQLLTAGSVSHVKEMGIRYERRYDETAVQIVLNMMENSNCHK